ncbi:MAG TPA: GAF domain-containing protein [Pseudomonadales bacterium]|nr:GAF domain-containing protein [Pseudomonadales bacterium]
MSERDFPVGIHEEKRLSVLKEMGILDSFEEKSFDEITEITALIFNVPTVTISLVDENRQWFKSHYGLDACQTERKIAFCNYTVLSDVILEVTDPQNDDRFTNNPLVTGELHLRYYCGAPIIVKGQTIGAFCLIDYTPRDPLNDNQRRILTGLANTVARAISHRHLLMKSTAVMADMLRNP